MADNVNEAVKEELINKLTELFVKGGTLKDVKGLDDAQMETLYALGFNLYQAGKSEDAEKVFRLLTLLDYSVLKYWLGFGASMQAQKKFDEAAQAYAMATILDIHDPRSQYHAAECFIAMGDKVKAGQALDTLELGAPQDSEYRAKAAVLRKAIAA